MPKHVRSKMSVLGQKKPIPMPKQSWERIRKDFELTGQRPTHPLAVPATKDKVYVYRVVSRAELDNVGEGGETGVFWTSDLTEVPIYEDKVVLVAETSHRKIVWRGLQRGEPDIRKNHFQQLEERTSSDIVAVLDHEGKSVPVEWLKDYPPEGVHVTAEPPVAPKGEIPKILQPLVNEAKKYDTFEEFERAFLVQLKHGLYFHFTNDPNFTIDPKLGPRDMSSMAFGVMTPGVLMITSHFDYWAASYGDRKYVAIIDMSEVPPDKYYQVKRGFGNEFFVSDPSKAKVTAILSRSAAKARDTRYHAKLPQSKEELREIWDKVKGLVQLHVR